MMDERPDADPWVFFTQQRGGTWVNRDNGVFLWIGEHPIFLAVGIAALIAFCVFCVVGCLRRLRSKETRQRWARDQMKDKV